MTLTRLFMATALFTTLLVGQALPQSPSTQHAGHPKPVHSKTSADVTSVRNTSYGVGSERVLRHEGIVDATVEQIWTTCTTAEGIRTYLAPVVAFELKTGGKYDTNYRPGSKIGDKGTIHNMVLAYLPEKMLAFKVGLTDRFPVGPREAGTLFAVLEFTKEAPNKVKVTISMAGWGSGPEWDEVYTFFDRGNA